MSISSLALAIVVILFAPCNSYWPLRGISRPAALCHYGRCRRPPRLAAAEEQDGLGHGEGYRISYDDDGFHQTVQPQSAGGDGSRRPSEEHSAELRIQADALWKSIVSGIDDDDNDDFYDDNFDRGNSAGEIRGREKHSQSRFGERGGQRSSTPYTRREGDNSVVDVAAVESLIEERVMSRRKRDFAASDEIRERLMEEHGVFVHDDEKIWHGNGRAREDNPAKFHRYSDSRELEHDRRRRQWSSPYTRHEGDSSMVDVAAVEALIEERAMWRRKKDFAAADEIRQELLDEHGVSVYDSEKTWHGGGADSLANSPAPKSHRYSRSREDGDDGQQRRWSPPYTRREEDHSDVDVAAVEALIEERAILKRKRKYEAADELQRQLREEHGVFVDDAEREWHGGYRAREDNSAKSNSYSQSREYGDERQSRPWSPPYARREGDNSAVDVAAVEALIEERTILKRERKYQAADELQRHLEEEYGVFVDDAEREWHTEGNLRIKSLREDARSNSIVWSKGRLRSYTIPQLEKHILKVGMNLHSYTKDNIKALLDTMASSQSKASKSVGVDVDSHKEALIDWLLTGLASSRALEEEAYELRASRKVDSIKEQLQNRGLKSTGRKEELITRLLIATSSDLLTWAVSSDDTRIDDISGLDDELKGVFGLGDSSHQDENLDEVDQTPRPAEMAEVEISEAADILADVESLGEDDSDGSIDPIAEEQMLQAPSNVLDEDLIGRIEDYELYEDDPLEYLDDDLVEDSIISQTADDEKAEDDAIDEVQDVVKSHGNDGAVEAALDDVATGGLSKERPAVSRMRKAELILECEERGIDASGTVADLRKRLRDERKVDV